MWADVSKQGRASARAEVVLRGENGSAPANLSLLLSPKLPGAAAYWPDAAAEDVTGRAGSRSGRGMWV